MNSLLGVELPTPVNFIIAFVVVLMLIAAATWLVRRFGMARLDATMRGRQPRLAVIDSANVDGRRKLVIIRRDNVEHLLMIGGPTDVVVETNIVRAAALGREAAAPRNGAAEAVPRTMPLPEATLWPLQPEPAPAAAAAARAERGPRTALEEAALWPAPAEPAAAPAPPLRAVRPADTLAGLAAELGRTAAEPSTAMRPAPAEPPPAAAPPMAPAAPSGPPVAAHPDHSLAEMAQRLEAALRRPVGPKPAAEAKPAARGEPKVAAAPANGEPQPKPQPKPQSADLEQELASLLGRPGKT